MERDRLSASEPGPPTKTVVGPDGSSIRFPDLPNVGEQRQSPNSATDASPERQSVSVTTKETALQVSNESWRDRIVSTARSTFERVGTCILSNMAHGLVAAGWTTIAVALAR